MEAMLNVLIKTGLSHGRHQEGDRGHPHTTGATRELMNAFAGGFLTPAHTRAHRGPAPPHLADVQLRDEFVFHNNLYVRYITRGKSSKTNRLNQLRKLVNIRSS